MKKIIKKIIKKENPEIPEPTLYDEAQMLIAELSDEMDDSPEDDDEDISGEAETTEKSMIRSPLKAIRRNCIICIGSIREVPNCTAEKSCPLFPFRMGKNPFRTPRVVTNEQREAARERFQKIRENKGKG